MKINKLDKIKQPKRLIEHMVASHGTPRHKKAYRSIIQNIIGLSRKVQGLTDKLLNAERERDDARSELAEVRKVMLYNGEPGTTMGVGDGTGNLFVTGDYESIKAAQKIVLRDSENRLKAYKMAVHVASSKFDLPDEWQEWANELESDLRRMSNV